MTTPTITASVFGDAFANTFWDMMQGKTPITAQHNGEWPASLVFFNGDEEILTLDGEEGVFETTLGCATTVRFVDVVPRYNRLTALDFDAFVLFLAQVCAAIPVATPQAILIASEDDLLPAMDLARTLA